MAADLSRAHALSVAVALASAQIHGVAVPRQVLVGDDVDEVALSAAQSWLAALLVEHGAAGLPGSALLALIGTVAAWVGSGGTDAGP